MRVAISVGSGGIKVPACAGRDRSGLETFPNERGPCPGPPDSTPADVAPPAPCLGSAVPFRRRPGWISRLLRPTSMATVADFDPRTPSIARVYDYLGCGMPIAPKRCGRL